MDLRYLFTSLDGRISRSSFWIGTVILTVANAALIGAMVLIFGISQLSVMLAVLVAILLAYPTYALMVKRFQDRDKAGWIAFFPLAVIYGTNMLDATGVLESKPGSALYTVLSLVALGPSLWILIELGILKGTHGPNRFGPDPLGHAQADATF
jgi:uncharacterized membrane protein YhaH (DUF805 family)